MTKQKVAELPEFINEQHIAFLEELRDSGRVNMMGAAPYLQNEFHCSSGEAHKILFYWMRTC